MFFVSMCSRFRGVHAAASLKLPFLDLHAYGARGVSAVCMPRPH